MAKAHDRKRLGSERRNDRDDGSLPHHADEHLTCASGAAPPRREDDVAGEIELPLEGFEVQAVPVEVGQPFELIENDQHDLL